MPNLFDTINTGISNFSANAFGNVNNQNTSTGSLVPGGFLPTSNLLNPTPSSVATMPSIPSTVQPDTGTTSASIITPKAANTYVSDTKGFLDNMRASQLAHATDTANQQAITDQNKLVTDQTNAVNDQTNTLKSAVLADQMTLTKNGETVTVPSSEAQPWIDNGYTQTTGTTPLTGDPNVDAIQAQIDNSNAELDASWTKYNDTVSNGSIPLTASQQSQLDAVKEEYQQLINAQGEANKNFQAGTDILSITQGINRYAPSIALGNAKRALDQGIAKISSITSQMNSALANLQDSMETKNYDKLRQSWSDFAAFQKQKSDALEAQKQQIINAKKDIIAQKEKQDQLIYDRVTQPIQNISIEAAKNGAIGSVISAINNSKTVDEAIVNAGSWLQTGTGDMANYLAYKRSKEQGGLTPLGFQEWKDEQDAKTAKLESQKAYSNAYASAAGKAAADAKYGVGDTSVTTEIDPTSQSILAQTGLSMPAFMFLTQGTSALTRMTAAQRTQYMTEAQNFANKNGIDVSTFRSQYTALGKTVEANSLRNNQAAVAEAELDATLKNIRTAADEASFKGLRWANVAKMFAGKEVNNEAISKYGFHLNQLREEFAMYNMALAGQIDANGNIRQINESDYQRADQIIKDGFAKGSIEGFASALEASRSKMKTVLESSISNQNQQVWKLFGVGENYQAPVDYKSAVDSYVSSNTSEASNIAQMYKTPGATDEDIYNWLKSNGKIK